MRIRSPDNFLTLNRLCLTLCCLWLNASLAAATGTATATAATLSPEQLIDRLHQALTQPDGQEPAQGAPQRLQRLTTIVLESHDFTTISRIAAGRFWRGLDAAQRQRFIEAMSRLSATTFASRFKPDSGLHFTKAVRMNSAATATSLPVKVSSQLIRLKGKPLTFEYVLKREGIDWKIINILVDGVSDLALRRAELSKIFQSSGYNGVMKHLADLTQQQLSELGTGALAS